jgi:hypothetical protein
VKHLLKPHNVHLHAVELTANPGELFQVVIAAVGFAGVKVALRQSQVRQVKGTHPKQAAFWGRKAIDHSSTDPR